MPRKRNGFVPLGDIAGGVELPGDRALTPAAAQTWHHFTRLDQTTSASRFPCPAPSTRPRYPQRRRAWRF